MRKSNLRIKSLLLTAICFLLHAFACGAPIETLDELRRIVREDYDEIVRSAENLRKRSFPADRNTILIKPSDYPANQIDASLLRLKPNFIALDSGIVTLSVGTIGEKVTLVCVYAEPGLKRVDEKEIERIGFRPVAEEVGALIQILRPPEE